MISERTSLTYRLAAVLLVVVLAACSGSDDTTDTTIAPDLPVLLAQAADTMGSVDSVAFTFALEGAPIFIDEADLVAFQEAEGRFVGPDLADALVTVKAAGVSTQIGAIAFEGETYLTNPFTGGWEPTPPDFGFNPATLFDPTLGWRPLFDGGLTNATYQGLDDVDGQTLYHIRGTGDEDRIRVITAGIVRVPTELDIWLSPVDASVVRVEFTTSLDGELTSWQLNLDRYGDTFTINRPDIEG